MRLFIYTSRLPENSFEERIILSEKEQPEYISRWTVKELDSSFSGEFGWKKLDNTTICAVQYINRKTIRFLVRAVDKQVANCIAKSFIKFFDVKKENRKTYSRKCPNAKIMNSILTIINGHMFNLLVVKN